MAREILFKAKRIDKNEGEWVEGYVSRPHSRDTEKGIVSYYFNAIDEMGWNYECIVSAETICQCAEKEYMDSDIAWEGDIFESQVSGDLMVLRYGTYQAFCPVDQQFMDSVGFYAECKGLPDMPIGDLKDYALKKGNIFDNPELLEVLS